MTQALPAPLVHMGRIVAARGLGGEVTLESYTEKPHDIASFGMLCDERGRRRFALKITGASGAALCARIEGVTSREQAEALKGQTLWLPREALPPLEDGRIYHVDLVGLAVVHEDGTPYGRIEAVRNFGAGDLIEIAVPNGKPTELLPFAPRFFPKVEVDKGRITIAPPDYTEG